MKSTAGFVFGLIGGIFDIFLGLLGALVSVILFFTINSLELQGKMSVLSGLIYLIFFLSAWFIILGVISIVFSIKMNSDDEFKKGAIGSLILGLLTINLFLIIGSFFTFFSSQKNLTGNLKTEVSLPEA
jgi:hypothetical protein